MPNVKELHVLPNPYAALDADGDPCGVAHRTDLHPGSTGGKTVRRPQPIGALVDLQRTPRDANGFHLAGTKYVFDDKPVTIANSEAHRRLVRDGAVLPADAATATACGVHFVAPDVAIENAKSRAAQTFFAAQGEFPHWFTPAEPKVATDAPKAVAVPKKPVAETPASSPVGGSS